MPSPIRRFCLAVITVAPGLLFAATAHAQAGGLYLPENGGPSNGTAQAGSAALARDAETAFLNPAGMTRLDAPEVMLGLMPFYAGIEFQSGSQGTASGSDGGNQGGWLPGAGLFVAMPVSERVALGFSATSPAGLVVDPSDDWVGRTWMTEATLVALNFEPSVGWRIADGLSVGAGIDVQYMTFEQSLRGPLAAGVGVGIDGDSWDVGFSLSTLWEVSDETRLGLRYRSEVDHSLSGDLTVIAPRPVSTSFTLPQSLTLSAYQDVAEDVALLLDVGWTDWSAFDYNVISFDGSGNQVALPRGFKDTWNVSLGAHLRTADEWLLMFGAGYVSSPVDNADRTPDLPVDQQVRVSAGFEFAPSERWRLGANYTFLWLGDNKIDQTRPLAGRIQGDYDAFAHLIGIHASLTF
jgi:long-chain fatty acid transport protein